jgi:adenosylcobinamide-phosphate synthase
LAVVVGLWLGGDLVFWGRVERLRDLVAGRAPAVRDIRKAVRLSAAVTFAAAVAIGVLR